jgi:hypothetical protein
VEPWAFLANELSNRTAAEVGFEARIIFGIVPPMREVDVGAAQNPAYAVYKAHIGEI